MVRRSKRGHVNASVVLEMLEIGRNGCIRVRTEAKIHSEEYVKAGLAMKTIDSLAEELTGDPELFWINMHSMGTGHG